MPDMDFYEIVIESHVDRKRARYFEGMTMKHLPEGLTLLSGAVLDQAELHSILNKIRDMGLILVSVEKKEKE